MGIVRKPYARRWVCPYPNTQQMPKDVVELPRNVRISVDYAGAMRDLIMYGSSAYFITYGPDKPQHIFAGRNDFGELGMTKVQFDVCEPLKGSKDAPVITAEQMSNFLYQGIGSGPGKEIAGILNKAAIWAGQLEVTYVEPKPATAHGLTIGGTYYLRDQEQYDGFFKGPIKVLGTYEDHLKSECRGVGNLAEGKVWSDKRCWFMAADLVAELPKPALTTRLGFTEGETVYSLRSQGKAPESIFGGPMTITQRQFDVGDTVIAVTAEGHEGGFSASDLVRELPKPTSIPIERRVRVHDLEVGDVLRFCGEPCGDCGGAAVLGQEYNVTATFSSSFYVNIPGWENGTFTGLGWSFVRRPGYVKPKQRLPYGVALVKEDRTKWAVGDILRVIEGDRYDHQGKDYFIDGEDYIIVGIYKDNGVSDVRVRLYNGSRHDMSTKSGSREQFKFVRAYADSDAWILRETPK